MSPIRRDKYRQNVKATTMKQMMLTQVMHEEIKQKSRKNIIQALLYLMALTMSNVLQKRKKQN